VTSNFVDFTDRAEGLALQPDGRILGRVGLNPVSRDGVIAAVRYNADGSLDPSFGSNGLATPVGDISFEALGIALQADGNIVVAGDQDVSGISSFVVARLIGKAPVPPPPPPANVRFIDKLYEQLLGREPDAGGLTFFTGLLNQGVSRFQVSLSIEQSQEYRTNAVEFLYEQLLGRRADAAGLNSFLKALGSGHFIEDVRVAILGSAEYYARAGGTANGFLTALYNDVLERIVDPLGQQVFSTMLRRGFAPTIVAFFVVHSLEARQRLVLNDYQAYLGRNPDPTGLAAFSAPRPGGFPDELILATILGSEEYFSRV
jgi:uncharacterized delta-60 repeat protein